MLKLVRRLVLLVLALSVITAAFLLYVSPSRTNHFVGTDGEKRANSIAEIRTINLNGIPQRLLIRGQDTRNPILLHVHGGPGGADQAIVRFAQMVERLKIFLRWFTGINAVRVRRIRLRSAHRTYR